MIVFYQRRTETANVALSNARAHMELDDQHKRELADSLLLSLQKRDWALLRSIVNPEIVWTFPGSNLLSGQARGVNAVIAACKDLSSYGPTFIRKEILYGARSVVLLIEISAARGDLALDTCLAAVLTVEGKQITAIEMCVSDIAMAEAFFTDRSCHARFRPAS